MRQPRGAQACALPARKRSVTWQSNFHWLARCRVPQRVLQRAAIACGAGSALCQTQLAPHSRPAQTDRAARQGGRGGDCSGGLRVSGAAAAETAEAMLRLAEAQGRARDTEPGRAMCHGRGASRASLARCRSRAMCCMSIRDGSMPAHWQAETVQASVSCLSSPVSTGTGAPPAYSISPSADSTLGGHRR